MSGEARKELQLISELVAQRNAIDAEIGAITGRPVVAGHLGEWIASKIFDIRLEDSAVSKAIDGHFSSGALHGQSVNVKWYGKREGLLDMTDDPRLDYYLVMTGPRGAATSSRGMSRALAIDAVYLFRAREVLEGCRARGVKVGVATSVRAGVWDAAEVFPRHDPRLPLAPWQRQTLELFRSRAD